MEAGWLKQYLHGSDSVSLAVGPDGMKHLLPALNNSAARKAVYGKAYVALRLGKERSIYRAGMILGFVRLTTRTMHFRGAHVRG